MHRPLWHTLAAATTLLCGSTPGTPFAAATTTTCFETNVDYTEANDVRTDPCVYEVRSPVACQAACASRADCHFWTHHAESSTCRLKGDLLKTAPNPFWGMAAGFFPTKPIPAEGAVSGPKRCAAPAAAAAVTTKSSFIEEMLLLETCAFPGLDTVAEVVRRCTKPGSPRFVHWQIAHAGVAKPGSYPRGRWEKCAPHRRTCRCYTRARFGRGGRWAHLDMADTPPHGGVACTAAKFPAFADGEAAPAHPSCECEASEAEMVRAAEATYLTVTMGSAEGPKGPCDIPLRFFSPQLDALSLGWGESAAHVAIGLASRCFPLLPRWASLASWKQDKKGFRLPCDSLTAHPLEGLLQSSPGPAALVYTQRINHWRTMHMNVSVDMRGAIADIFNLHVPGVLLGGDASGKGNPDIPGWAAQGWSHPCCMYVVTEAVAHRSFSKFFLLVTAHLSRSAAPSSDAAYCLLWKQSGCIARWYGYLGEALFVLWLYLTQQLVAAHPGATGDQCAVIQPQRHVLYGSLTHADIEAAYDELFP